jgi:hypothetical protein
MTREQKRGLKYYQDAVLEGVRAGFNDIFEDTDARLTEIMAYITDNNLSFKFAEDVDYVQELCPRTHVEYKYFQPRAMDTKGETGDSVVIQQYFEDFHKVGNLPQRRPAIAFRLDGYLFPALGNKRSRSNKKAQEEGYTPNGLFEIDLSSDYDDEETITAWSRFHGAAIAAISNRNLYDAPEPETTADMVHKVKNLYHATAGVDPTVDALKGEERVEWVQDWLLKNEDKYNGDAYKAWRSKVAREAFSDETSASVEMPDITEIQREWRQGYPRELFDPDNENSETTYLSVSTASEQVLERLLTLPFLRREEFTEARPDYALTLRVGAVKGQDKTNIASLKKAKEKIREFLVEWNSNPNKIHCGLPRVVRVLFVKQLMSGDAYEMWEWATDGSKTWIKVDLV